ncbi:MAG: hypothetical protein ABIJ75_10235 [Actinomycetota bacterium]
MAWRTATFNYSGLPKSGTQFFGRYLHVEHGAVIDPPGSSHEPATGGTWYGSIRPPWDWYGSWYNHALKTNGGGYVFAELLKEYGNGSTDFKDVLYGATHGVEISARPGVIWEAELPVGQGLWSRCVRHMYGPPWRASTLFACDRAYDALEEAFGYVDRYRHPLKNTGARRYDRSSPDRITDYRSWYTPEMLSWVADADADLIALFGFEPFRPSPKALYSLTQEVPKCTSPCPTMSPPAKSLA